jgi:hypothetical protein
LPTHDGLQACSAAQGALIGGGFTLVRPRRHFRVHAIAHHFVAPIQLRGHQIGCHLAHQNVHAKAEHHQNESDGHNADEDISKDQTIAEPPDSPAE